MFRSDLPSTNTQGRQRSWLVLGQLCLLALTLSAVHPGSAQTEEGSSPSTGSTPQPEAPNSDSAAPKADPPANGAKHELAPPPDRPRGCPFRDRSLNLIV